MYPACVDFLHFEKLTIDDICPKAPFPDGKIPDDSAYGALFPGETVFRYIINEDGVPVQVLRGNSAVYYTRRGERVEKPVLFIKARNWPEAVMCIINPVETAHWIGNSFDKAICSFCCYEIETGFESVQAAMESWNKLLPYCPNCGMKILDSPYY